MLRICVIKTIERLAAAIAKHITRTYL